MKLITRNSDYAIRAVLYIAGSKKKVVSAEELVRKLSMPRQFIRKILQILHKNGILKSVKGVNGGFKLSCPPDKIYAKDIIKIFQKDFNIVECFFKKKICPNIKTCVLRKRFKYIENIVASEINKINIAFLLKG